MQRSAQGRSAAPGSVDNPSVVPQTLRAIYGMGDNLSGARQRSSVANTSLSQAVAELQHVLGPEGFAEGDMAAFSKAMLLDDSVAPVSVVGGKNDGIDPTGESTADLQIIGAVAQVVSTVYWMVDEWVYELALALSASEAPPSVVSISWGFAETRQCGPTDFGPDMPANCSLLGILSNTSYVWRANAEFLKLSARGVTLVASSGDSGAPGSANPSCAHDDNPTRALNPEFPAASPYVLSVGATALDTDPAAPAVRILSRLSASTPEPCRLSLLGPSLQCAANGTERAATSRGGAARITSGGGFSRLAARPKWQAAAVQAYLAQMAAALPPAEYFNGSSGRAYPDVAALGHNVLIYQAGAGAKGKGKDWVHFDGTSAAAPIWAGIISTLNAERAAIGRAPLGFAPPLLYSFAAAEAAKGSAGFNAPRAASSNECTAEGICCSHGFPTNSAKGGGWDPVLGLGSPKVDRLAEYVRALP